MAKYVGLLRLVGMGWLLVVSIAIGLFVGYWLDTYLHTTPLFIIIGITVGVVTGFVAFFRLLSEIVREQGLTSGQSDSHRDRKHHLGGTEE